MNYTTENTNRGFALIEITTVLSIIAILIGLLIPALQPVREETNRQRVLGDLKSRCEIGVSQGYVLKDLLVSSFSNGFTLRTNLAANTLIAEPAFPGRTGSVTITMQYGKGCPYSESPSARASAERQRMYTELLVGAARTVGLMVNGLSGNDALALHNIVTGGYPMTVGPELRDTGGNSVSFGSILNPNAVWTGRETWVAAIEMVMSAMRLNAAGENYLTLPSIGVPAAPIGVQLFSHGGMVSLVNAMSDGTSNTIMLAELNTLRQNATQTARDAFIQDVNQAAQSGTITLQDADALIDIMWIVY